jgi:hypothetical protein
MNSFIRITISGIVLMYSTVNHPDARSCTIVFAEQNNMVLTGANEDANNPNSKMWIVPATEDTYGRVCFGFDKEYKIAENGINDQGLFIDVNTLNIDTGWKPDPDKPDWEEWEGWFGTGVPDGILAKCATVREAIEIFQEYNLLTFAKIKYLLGDKTGESAVLEWSEDRLRIVHRDSHYQISTNFVSSNYHPQDYPCERYRIAEKILNQNANHLSMDVIRAVLSATCFEYFSFSPTVYSICFNLSTGDMRIYLFHNFEQPIQTNIFNELDKGAARYRLHDLFAIRSFSYLQFIEKAGGLRDPLPIN